jgi:type IV pilus assembly protein PilC
MDIFDKFTVAMVRVGETGGVLEQVLVKLAASSKRRTALKGQIIGALAYPCVLLIVAGIVLLVLMGFAVPRFADLFAKAGLELPIATKILISVSNFVSTNWIAVLVGFVVFIVLLVYYAITESGRNTLVETSLSIPVIRDVTKRYFVVQISESMGLLLQAGVPLRELLLAIENTMTIPTPKATVQKMKQYIDQGSNLKTALENDPIFPPMAQKLIETGETTGTMDSMFNEIATYYDEQLNAAIKAALSIMEPCLIVIMAVLVGFIMIAVFIPLFKMSFIRPK